MVAIGEGLTEIYVEMFLLDLQPLQFSLLAFLSLVSPISAIVARNWTNPNANLPSFTSTYLVGERIYLSWQPLNQSTNDLWLVGYAASNDFTLRIASALDLSQPGSFPWTIAVGQEQVEADTRFMLAMVPTGSAYVATTDSGLNSPAFNLMMVNQNTPPNGTASGSATATGTTTGITSPATVTSSSASATSEPSHSRNPSHLSTMETIGIAVGVLAVVGLACFFGGYLLFKKRVSRHTKKLSTDLGVPMTGPYEVLGSNHDPAEMNGKGAQVHEMVASREVLSHESDSTPVHEVGNTVKRPGLHEMPG